MWVAAFVSLAWFRVQKHHAGIGLPSIQPKEGEGRWSRRKKFKILPKLLRKNLAEYLQEEIKLPYLTWPERCVTLE